MDLGCGRVQFLQAQLFPVCTLTPATTSGFLGSFLSKSIKTNQLEVNTDEKTLRSIARLKEPRDLFALPKDKDHDCPQQAPRWPIECQVIDERMIHIQSVPAQPEPYNQPTGSELKPRTVGEENGVVVFNYNPISAVNYEKPAKCKAAGDDSSDSDSSSDSSPEVSTPDRRKIEMKTRFVKMLDILRRSTSNSEDEIERSLVNDADDDDTITNISTNSNINNKNVNESSHAEVNVLNSEDKEKVEKDWPSQVITKPKLKQPKPMLYTPVRKNFAPNIERLEGGANQVLSRKRSSSSDGSSSSGTSDNENDIEPNWTIYGSITKKIQAGLDPELTNHKLTSKTERILETQTELKKLRELTLSFQNPNLSGNQSRNQNQKIEINDEEFAKLNSKYNAMHSELTQVEKSISLVPPFEPQFSRSAVGGSKFLTNCHPHADDYDGLEFESRFESGNLAKAVMITPTYYELYLRPDLYTSRSKQWFYFRVRRTKKNQVYRFSIVNLVKSDSLYNEGMCPLMYSTINAKEQNEGWRRCGQNIVYYRNDEESGLDDEDDNASYSLTWNIEFQHDNDTVFFAHSYPYTYSDLQDYLMEIQKHPVKSKFCKLRLLCRSLAGNNVYYLTVTAPTTDEEVMKRKKAVVVSARVHPSETPSSWMMKGLMDFITGDTSVAKRLRHRFIFKLIPMLNPDGVIVGNTRNSLTGKDLNRQYRTVIRETYPSIWYTKAMIKRLIDECGVTIYCDMHAHSRKHNIFIYGCENRRTPDKKLTEQVFPLMMHKNVADKFSFEDCKFKIQRSKEGTGRIVVWMLGITNSYTIEASFGGSTLGSRRGTHFSTGERLRLKIIERLLKEGSSAEEPLNIPLSDYSSDEGDSSSSSDNEGKASITQSDLEGPCCASLKAPPCSPEVTIEARKFNQKRMRKVMQELDRIYFQPLFKKKFRALIKSKRLKIKNTKPDRLKKNSNTGSKKSLKSQESETVPNIDGFMNSSECDKSASEMRSEFEHSVLNTAEGTRIASGLSKVVKTPICKKKKPFEDYEGGIYMVEKAPPRKIRVSRKLRLWLEKRQIIIFRKLKKTKSKTRSKTWVSKNKPLRLAFDMPTTDPGSDLVFSTDDEYCTENSDPPQPQNEGYGTIPRARRLLQSDLQRRYIEEFGGDTVSRKQMPPELIITSPTKQNTKPKPASYAFPFKSMQSPMPRTAPPGQLISEFPIIGAPTTKRTSSWHNLHRGSKSTPKSKTTNPYMPMSENTNRDELQFRLSLKKKIWSGLQPEGTTNQDLVRNRPLSWGMPPVATQTKRERTINQSNKKDDKETLFTACSQKLIAWQQQVIMPTVSSTVMTSSTYNKTKSKFVTNVSESIDDASGLGVLRQITYSKSTQKSPYRTDLTATDSKAKKRKNPMTKITDTTQLITRLSKTKSHTSVNGAFGMSQRRFKSPTPSTTTLHANRKSSLQSNKFKTGGLVATATAQPKKNRKLRSMSNNLESKPTGQVEGRQGIKQSSTTLAGRERTLGVITIDMQAPSEDLSTRKVKTKLRRKPKKQTTPDAAPTSTTVTLTANVK